MILEVQRNLQGIPYFLMLACTQQLLYSKSQSSLYSICSSISTDEWGKWVYTWVNYEEHDGQLPIFILSAEERKEEKGAFLVLAILLYVF